MKTSKLALGTVQFGVDYGVSNQSGKTSFEEVISILKCAREYKVDTLDSALRYGDAHKVLAQTQMLSDFKLVTKLGELSSADDIEPHVLQILDDLELKYVYGVMFHSFADLVKFENGFSKLKELKDKGYVTKVGVSVYDVSEIKEIIQSYDIDIIQIPLGILNQEIAHTGLLEELKKRGVEIHVRSIFLQGLTFITPDELDKYFEPVKSKLIEFHSDCSKLNIPPAQMALSYILSLPQVDKIVMGVNSKQQLIENINLLNAIDLSHEIDFNKYDLEDSKYTDPRLWQLQKQ